MAISLLPRRREISLPVGLNTRYSSGFATPCTMFSPRPNTAVMNTTPVEAALGVEREHHAGAGLIRAHHLLDADREIDLLVIEAALGAVRDRPVREERGEALAAGLRQVRQAVDVQVRLLLPGEAGVGQVLGGGARTHRDVRGLLPVATGEVGVGLLDLAAAARAAAGPREARGAPRRRPRAASRRPPGRCRPARRAAARARPGPSRSAL